MLALTVAALPAGFSPCPPGCRLPRPTGSTRGKAGTKLPPCCARNIVCKDSHFIIYAKIKSWEIQPGIPAKKKWRGFSAESPSTLICAVCKYYIIPPIPAPPPIGIAGFSSGLSTMRHSVVRNIPAIEAAFSRATRETLAGSITPALRISS